MTTTPAVPLEAAWDTAPGLLDGAKNLTLTAHQCDLPYWLGAVAQGTLAGRAENGHAPTAAVPAYMREPGPLRDSLVLELAYRSLAEEKCTRYLGYFVANAPGIPELEFYATQLIDEARHSMVFRNHLVELGLPAAGIVEHIDELARDYDKQVLAPLEEFALPILTDPEDFIGAVAILTIVVEGVLAPAAELSERKWGLLDPAAGEIARGAAIDEIRHLTVGSSVIREHLIRDPSYTPRVAEIIEGGMRLWTEVPDREFVLRRERMFQEGLADHAELLRDYEVWPGRRLLDTTPEERYDTALAWTEEMAGARMVYMGLAEG
jgi:hypothetical protein